MRKYGFYPLLFLAICVITSFKKPLKDEGLFLVVSKSNYEIKVYDANNNWKATYPCVFGNDDQSDKLVMGDRRTPEGIYHIVIKKTHPKWDKYFGLDYPTPEDVAKFNDRKAKGIIPQNAKIGDGIGIHGTWPKQDFVVDTYQNWTNGCVCTKNEYIDELYNTLPIGTKVIIVK
jgi:murein L,D-transpeptidase YafK